jgi:hypothetical protein
MITQFEIVNPIPIRTKPHLNRRGELVIPNIATQHYNWYLEVAKDNTITFDREYYILFGHNKFDHNCIKLYKDYGRRFVVNLHGEIADFVHREIIARGNVDVNYLYSEDEFDVWQIE